jgi:hypothetical protein
MPVTYKHLGVNGALGNQLWEIAGTCGIAHQRNDYPSFPRWEYERYFSVPSQLFSREEGDDLGRDYLQELHYWSGIQPTIQKYFRPSHEARSFIERRYSDLLKYRHLTAVHVRRANNLQLPDHHPVPTLEYFEGAIDMMNGGQLVVFSDDLEWCRSQSIFKDAYFADGNPNTMDIYQLTNSTPLSLSSVAYDFHLMQMCKDFVISNSSYSWWAAYLSGSRTVVYPRKWYGPALAHIDISPMIPEHWLSYEAS